jgi:hypothetical protein
VTKALGETARSVDFLAVCRAIDFFCDVLEHRFVQEQLGQRPHEAIDLELQARGTGDQYRPDQAHVAVANDTGSPIRRHACDKS